MSDRIEQCKADIAKLQEELKRLEDEAKPKPRHGDIAAASHGTGGTGRRIIIVTDDGRAISYSADGHVQYGPVSVAQMAVCYRNSGYIVLGNVFDQVEGK